MNRLLFLFLIPIFLQTTPPPNPEVAAYRARMDHAQDLQDSLLDAFEGKDAKAVARQASELTALLQADVQYWEAAKIAKATELGKDSVRLSKLLEQHASSGDLQEAEKDNRQLQITCRSCHDTHFEKQAAHPSR